MQVQYVLSFPQGEAVRVLGCWPASCLAQCGTGRTALRAAHRVRKFASVACVHSLNK